MGGDGGNFFLARVINLMVGNVLLVYWLVSLNIINGIFAGQYECFLISYISSEVILLGWSEVSVGFTYRTVGLKVVGVFIQWFVC